MALLEIGWVKGIMQELSMNLDPDNQDGLEMVVASRSTMLLLMALRSRFPDKETEISRIEKHIDELIDAG